MKKIFCLVMFCSIILVGHSQSWEVGGWIGTANYQGDLNPNFTLEHPGLAAGALLRYNFNTRLSVKVSGNYGEVFGNDAFSDEVFQRERNLSFDSKIYDGTLQFEFNFLKYEHGSEDHFFTPYLFGGISIFYFNPTTTFEGKTYDLQSLGTEGQFKGDEYALTQPALAFGGGFKVDISYDWSINLELSARRLFTDYLDDVSKTYPDMDDLEEARGEVAVQLSDRSYSGISQPGRQRGNSQDRDMYFFIGLTLAYNFARINCPYF